MRVVIAAKTLCAAALAALLAFITAGGTWAQNCVGSQCADGYTGCGCGEDSARCCREHMLGKTGTIRHRAPQPDSGVERRKAEEMERHRQDDLEREKQAEFEQSRKNLQCSLKGVSCAQETPVMKSGTAGELELKGTGNYEDPKLKQGYEGWGAAGDTQIKKSYRGKSRRPWSDGTGSETARAWAKLSCGASLFGASLLVARDSIQKADVERVRYLADEAIGALEGREYGEACPPGPKMPGIEGKSSPPMAEVKAFYRAAAAQAQTQSRRVFEDNQKLAAEKPEVSRNGIYSDKARAQKRIAELERLNRALLQDPERAEEYSALLK